MRILFIAIIALCVVISSCKKYDNGDKVPHISNLTISHDSVTVNTGDTVFVNFYFRDKNGDIAETIYAIDSRDSNKGVVTLSMPPIDEFYKDPLKGISGSAYVPMSVDQFFIPRQSRLSGDTLTYEFYIKDEEGNESNHISTPFIYIVP